MEQLKKTFYAPVIKSKAGDGYTCILSDTQMDRDQEFIGKAFLDSAARSEWLPGLMDHENKALNLVCEWVNKRVIKRSNGSYALAADPKFYASNPNAMIIKGMLDDGAKIGISITAIPSSQDEVTISGKSYTRYPDGEMISADWVGIPANKSSFGMEAIAKSFDLAKSFLVEKENNPEVDVMENEAEFKKSLLEGIKTEVVAAIEKRSEEVVALRKEVADLMKMISELQKAKEVTLVAEETEKAAKAAELEKAAKDRDETLKALNALPAADIVTKAAVVVDEKPSVGTFIKMYNQKPEVKV